MKTLFLFAFALLSSAQFCRCRSRLRVRIANPTISATRASSEAFRFSRNHPNGGQSRGAEGGFCSGVHRLLETAIGETLQSSRFSASCEGQTVRLLYIFELKGLPQQAGSDHVLFRPPNVFVIRSSPFPVSGLTAP